MREQSIDAMVYDYLLDLYNEVRNTDIDELARICGNVDRSWIEADQKKTLHMIDSVRNLVAHRL